jgi:hypothetical protein
VTVNAAGQSIGGIEALFRHKEYGAPYAEPTAGPSFPVLPAGQRTSRETMLHEVDAFYRSVNAHASSPPASLAPGCAWSVNGQSVGPCDAPFVQRAFAGLEQVRDIRALAVDDTRGLVVMSTYEDFPEADRSAAATPGVPHWPHTLQTVELFRFENGKITRVEAYTAELPYGMKPHGEGLVVDRRDARYAATLMKPTP